MLMRKERELVAEYGRRMSSAGLSTGTSGNLSIYDPQGGLMAISPSGIGYFDTQPEDVVVMDLEGGVVEGSRKPSSEWGLHALFYRKKPGARAVVHTHSMYCTTFAVLGQPIQAVHYAIADAGAGTVPCAPYHLFGTPELAEAAVRTAGASNAVLLANHGLVVCGKDQPGQEHGVCGGTPIPGLLHREAQRSQRRGHGGCDGALQDLRSAGGGKKRLLTEPRASKRTFGSTAPEGPFWHIRKTIRAPC